MHGLKLHPEGEGAQPTTKKPVVSEKYEEIVFSEPTAALHALLSSHTPRLAPHSDTANWVPRHSDREELWNILQARRVVADHTAQMQAQLRALGAS